MKDGQLLRVKVIKTATDLPKEEGNYIVHINSNRNEQENTSNWYYDNKKESFWMFHIDWYLQPIEEQESKSEKQVTDKIIEKWAKDVNQRNFSYSFYDGLITGAKWMRERLKIK